MRNSCSSVVRILGVVCLSFSASARVVADPAASPPITAESQSAIEVRGQLGDVMPVTLSLAGATTDGAEGRSAIRFRGQSIDVGPRATLSLELAGADLAATARAWDIQEVDRTLVARFGKTDTIIVGRHRTEGERVLIELEALGSKRVLSVSLAASSEKMAEMIMADALTTQRFGMLVGLSIMGSFEAPNAIEQGQGGTQINLQQCLNIAMEACRQDCNGPQVSGGVRNCIDSYTWTSTSCSFTCMTFADCCRDKKP